MRKSCSLWIFSLVILFFSPSHSFYLPGVAPRDFDRASQCGTSSTVSRSFTEGSKKELENTASKADYRVKIDPALTSTSTDTFTGIFLPECESGSQGIYQPHLEAAIPSSLIVESDADNSNSIEVSSVQNTELEEHTLRAENQSGDALEECNALDFQRKALCMI